MSQKNYQNISELIRDLLTADRDENHDAYINIDNFSGAFYKGVEDQTDDFWKELLEFLKNNSPTLASDFNDYIGKASSVFSFINSKADLNNDTIWNKVTEAMRGENNHLDLSTDSGVDNDDYFWNESLSKLIAIFVSDIGNDNSKIYLNPGDETSVITLSSIKNADAGYDFSNDYVLPTTNIDGVTYTAARGNDAIKTVLNNSSELQYTRSQGSDKWIRLLMPKYLRKVEVEDLNRNFWVIAQVMSAVCAYLFGQDSIKDLFEGILKELVGLWENVLYLWAAAAMISQKDTVTDIHVEFVPLTNSTLYDYRKFDNFTEYLPIASSTFSNLLKERLHYLIASYSESNLVIIPEVRMENYKHNYYQCVIYPGMLIYDRNTGKEIWCRFVVDQNWRVNSYLGFNLKSDFNADTHKLVDRIGGIVEEENTYSFIDDFSSVQGTSPYYAAIRTIIPDFSINYDTENKTIIIENFSIRFYDAAAQAITGEQYPILTFTQHDSSWNIDTSSVSDTPIELNLDWAYDTKSSTYPATATNVPIARGYYLGELTSCQSILSLNSWTVNAQAYSGQQLYSATPEQIVDIMEASE